MKLDVKIQLLKFCSHVFNSIFMVLGLSVTGCGIWILFDRGSFLTVKPSAELQTVGVGLLAIGGVVLLLSIAGCVGADGEVRVLLLMYLGFLIVLVLGQLFVTLLLLINRDKIERSLDAAVDQIIVQYGADRPVSEDRLMDSLQSHEKCCGRMGPADWLNNSYIQTLNLTNQEVLPCSCFSFSRPSSNSAWCIELLHANDMQEGRGNGTYDQGCKTKLSDWLQENAMTIVGMDIGLILLQVLQFVVMVHLYRAFIRKGAPTKSSDHAHLDPAPKDDLEYTEQNYGYIHPDDGCIDPAHYEHYHDYENGVGPAHQVYHRDNQDYS